MQIYSAALGVLQTYTPHVTRTVFGLHELCYLNLLTALWMRAYEDGFTRFTILVLIHLLLTTEKTSTWFVMKDGLLAAGANSSYLS